MEYLRFLSGNLRPVRSPQNPLADVVLIHGLTVDNNKAWSSSGEAKNFWPTDLLLEDFPSLQIFAYDYTWTKIGTGLAQPPKRSSLGAALIPSRLPMSWPGVPPSSEEIARDLSSKILASRVTLASGSSIRALLGIRSSRGVYDSRPVIFIAYGFGCTLCVSAMKNLDSITAGAVFFAAEYGNEDSQSFSRCEIKHIRSKNIPEVLAAKTDLGQLRSKQDPDYIEVLNYFGRLMRDLQENSFETIKNAPDKIWSALRSRGSAGHREATAETTKIAELASALSLTSRRFRTYVLTPEIVTKLRTFEISLDELLSSFNNRHMVGKYMSPVMDSLREISALINKQPRIPKVKHSFTGLKVPESPSEFSHDGVNRNDDVDLNLPLISHPLEKSSIAWVDWKKLEPEIVKYLDTQKVQWSMLDLCYRRRPGFTYEGIPETPVAFVIAQKSDPTAWKALKEGIEEIIQQGKVIKPIRVELMNGKISPHFPSMGSGIICGDSMATLGGYIHLHKITEKSTVDILPNIVFGLTNHHAVRPPPYQEVADERITTQARTTASLTESNLTSGSAAKHGNVAGTVTAVGDCYSNFEWRSPIAFEETISGRRLIRLVDAGITKQRVSAETTETQRLAKLNKGTSLDERLNSTTRAYEASSQSPENNDPELGTVRVSSGLRMTNSSEPRRLDWAIIQINDDFDMGIDYLNLAPPPRYENEYKLPLSLTLYQRHDLPLSGFAVRLGRLGNHEQLVGKFGWRTTSYGIISDKKRRVKAADSGQTTFETVMYGRDLNYWPNGHPPSLPGDSGSWVLNSEGDLVGVLWGGDGINYALVTPIEEVVQDIENQTGYTVVLPGGTL